MKPEMVLGDDFRLSRAKALPVAHSFISGFTLDLELQDQMSSMK
jgi:hypothetical protein